MTLRLMTNKEWDRLVKLTDGDDDLMHWHEIAALVAEDLAITSHAIARGWLGPSNLDTCGKDQRLNYLGFRPVLDDVCTDLVPRSIQDGQVVAVGTLFMGGEPVPVPQNPVHTSGDIMKYVPGTALELRAPMDDPLYIVTGIKDKRKVYIDRCLLTNISYDDIIAALLMPYKHPPRP